jgi:hypothetical protein
MRFAWAVRPSAGFRLAWVAGAVAITAALLVALREFLSGIVSPAKTVDVLGFAAAAMGTLRLVGAFEIERRTSHRWSIGGLILGGLELGTGIILLVATDTQSNALMITVGGVGACERHASHARGGPRPPGRARNPGFPRRRCSSQRIGRG